MPFFGGYDNDVSNAHDLGDANNYYKISAKLDLISDIINVDTIIKLKRDLINKQNRLLKIVEVIKEYNSKASYHVRNNPLSYESGLEYYKAQAYDDIVKIIEETGGLE